MLPSHQSNPYAAFRVGGYPNYIIGAFIAVVGRQMLAAAIGYQVYVLTNSKAALGLIGLAGVLPLLVMSLIAGHVADRLNRKWIIIITQAVQMLSSVVLAWLASSWNRDAIPIDGDSPFCGALRSIVALFGETDSVVFPNEVPVMYGLLILNGLARAFGWAARGPFVANLVPRTVLANAVTWNTSMFEIGCVVGPAVGGLLLAKYHFSFVCWMDALASLISVVCLLPIPYQQLPIKAHARPVHEFFAGIRFVWQTKEILAAITLDMFAVLLGGATALIPVFARDILHVDEVHFGWLRAAPSLGAISMAMIVAHSPPMKRPGVVLLWAVIGFGASMIVFGFSRVYAISFIALVISGALDNISVVVRHTLVQLLTPDAMRGRVAAVNNIFIGASNELGALESGLTAALWGPVASVVIGGFGTIGVVLAIAATWPQIRRIKPLHEMIEQAREE